MNESRRSGSRKGNREVISVALPIHIYDALQKVCEEHDINRSSLIASAIANHLARLGVKVGER